MPQGNEAKLPAYDADSIKVLKGLDAVRKRPGMYIGDTDDGSGLHHMVYEVVDNAIDETLAGHADRITVTLNADGSCTVTDNGRGIPVDIHKSEGVSAAEVIMTQLHAGGKFDQNSYKVSGGLHGVGVSVVNALSIWLKLTIYRNGKLHSINFTNGDADGPLQTLGPAEGKRGTEVTFLPSPATFTKTEFDFATIEHRLRELAFLNSGVRILLSDHRGVEPKDVELYYEGGIQAFVRYLDRTKQAAIKDPIMIRGEKDGLTVECSLWWNDSYHENVLCFTNNIPQRDGGTHLAGFRGALTRVINTYAASSGIAKKEKVAITGDDAREGLTCVLSVKVPDPKFSSQTKDKLVSSEVRPVVESLVNEQLGAWFEEHPAGCENHRRTRWPKPPPPAKPPARPATSRAARARWIWQAFPASWRNARTAIRPRPKSSSSRATRPAAPPSRRGTARTRPCCPCAEKFSTSNAPASTRCCPPPEIGTLITALGTGIGRDENGDGFNIEKLRYHKIIIMTDADVDGAHIRTLLLTFFYRQMPEVIDRGYLYIAQPPLYKVKRGTSEQYLKDNKALEDYLIDTGLDGTTLALADGSERAGADLRAIVEEALQVRSALDALHSRYPRNVVEQTAIAGALNPEAISNHEHALAAALYISKRLDVISEETERGWVGAVSEDGGLAFSREVRGVKESWAIDAKLIGSSDVLRLDKKAAHLQEIYARPAKLRRKESDTVIHGPLDLLEAIFAAARKGISMQRYKGLGEMNPEQLWETTLDSNVRSLLRVKVSELDEADDIFTKLMGDVVEPRRDFIRENALNVANLDV